MFELIKISDNCDCTANYIVNLDRTYTVKEFIEEVLSTKKDESGYFLIFNPKTYRTFDRPKCRYRYGSIISESFSENILQKTIKEIHANSGYTRTDYTIKFEHYKTEACKTTKKPIDMTRLMFKEDLDD